MNLMEALIAAKMGGGGGGGSLTPANVLSAIEGMSDAQAAAALAALGGISTDDLSAYALKPIVTTVSGSTPIIALCENNHIYECGECSSLTITAFDNPGSFIIHFLSGATATTTTLPAGMVFPDTFTPEANTRYEINCVDGYALVAGWPYTPPAAEE